MTKTPASEPVRDQELADQLQVLTQQNAQLTRLVTVLINQRNNAMNDLADAQASLLTQ